MFHRNTSSTGAVSMVMLVFRGVTFQVFNKINFWGVSFDGFSKHLDLEDAQNPLCKNLSERT